MINKSDFVLVAVKGSNIFHITFNDKHTSISHAITICGIGIIDSWVVMQSGAEVCRGES